MKAKSVHARDEARRIAANIAKLAGAFAEAVIRSVELIVQPEAHPRYSSLDVWPSRQARNAAAACSRSSALLNLRRGCFGGWLATGVAPLTSSTPCRRMRLRLAARDQFTRPDITHFLRQQQSMVIMMVVMPVIVAVTVRRVAAHEDAACWAKLR